MTCVVHYGVTRDWRRRGVYGMGCRPRQQKAPPPPPFGTVNAGPFLRNPNTHTYSPKSHVKTPNRWLCLISASLNLIPLHVAITQHAKLVSALTDWQTSMNFQTDALSSILAPSSAPKRVFRLPSGMLHKHMICYLQRNICKLWMNRLAIGPCQIPVPHCPSETETWTKSWISEREMEGREVIRMDKMSAGWLKWTDGCQRRLATDACTPPRLSAQLRHPYIFSHLHFCRLSLKHNRESIITHYYDNYEHM